MKKPIKRPVTYAAANQVQFFALFPNNKVRLVATNETTGCTYLLAYWVPRRDWLAIRRLARKFNRLASGEIRGTFYKQVSRR